MTAYPSQGTWSLRPVAAGRCDVGWPSRQDAESLDALVGVTVALRRCAMYRKAFRGAVINFPAGLLSQDSVARWVRRHGVGVDVASDDDLDQAVTAGISLSHIVMHRADGFTAPIRLAANAGRHVRRELRPTDRDARRLRSTCSAGAARRDQRIRRRFGRSGRGPLCAVPVSAACPCAVAPAFGGYPSR
jgi:hypothetical protein